MRSVISVLLTAVVVAFAGGPVRGADSPTLEERAVAIERVVEEPDGARVVIGHLSRKLHIPTDELQTQHKETGLGWGELLVANLVSRMGKVTVAQVVGEFRNGQTWETIARDHHVNLDKLEDAVEGSQEIVERREEDRAPATSSGDGSKRRSSGPRAGDAGAGAGRTRR